MNRPDRRSFLQSTSGAVAAAGMIDTASAADRPTTPKDVPLAPPDKQPPDVKIPVRPARKVGFAVVGLGKLAIEEVLPAFGLCEVARPAALVSGHPEKARKLAEYYGIDPKSIYDYTNYDKLADNPAVEAVFVILPNSMHAEFTVRAHKAGKHVLCEKPMATSVKEGEQMIAAAKEARRKLMVAYRLHYEPMNVHAATITAARKLGPIRYISSGNCQVVQAPNIRLSKSLGGGPVGDIGLYSINACRYLTGEEPAEVTAQAQKLPDDPRFREVPPGVAFALRYASGIVANCHCSFAAATSRYFRVECAEGVVGMDPAFSYRGLKLFVETEKGREEPQIRQVNHFAAEMDHFARCILEDKAPRSSAEEGLADMRIIEAIDEAAKSGRAVKIRG